MYHCNSFSFKSVALIRSNPSHLRSCLRSYPLPLMPSNRISKSPAAASHHLCQASHPNQHPRMRSLTMYVLWHMVDARGERVRVILRKLRILNQVIAAMSPARNRAHCFFVCALLVIFFAAENAGIIHSSRTCCGQQQCSNRDQDVVHRIVSGLREICVRSVCCYGGCRSR